MNMSFIKLRLGASGGYPVGLSVGLSSTRNFVGGCVGGLSQVFKASDWPNSNLKDYKKNVSCYLRKVALSVCLSVGLSSTQNA